MSKKSRVWSLEKRIDDFILFVIFCVFLALAAWGTLVMFDIGSSINT